MDLQRNIIVVAIAVVAYLLLLAWMEDYGTGQQSVSADAVVEQESSPVLVDSIQRANESAPDSRAVLTDDSDVPEITIRQSAPRIAGGEVEETGELILVDTGTIEYKIDLKRGDIQEVVLKKYPLNLDYPNQYLFLLQNSKERVYIAQSGLVGKDGPDRRQSNRKNFSSSAREYRIGKSERSLQVDLMLQQESGVFITKRFTFQRDQYDVKIEYIIDNPTTKPWQGIFFGQLKRDHSSDPSSTGSPLGMVTYLGAAYGYPEQLYKKHSFDDMKDEPLKMSYANGWIAMLQHYFVTAWVPDPTQKSEIGSRQKNGFNFISFNSQPINVEPQSQEVVFATFYAGPKKQDKLKELSDGLDKTVDYGWLWIIAQPLFWLLTKIQGLVGNWGIAIILLTLTVKAAFFSLSARGYRSMAKMRLVTPEITRIRAQYKDDRQKQSQAMMELYKKKQINPLGGCLPILIQMPVFLSLYWVLMESVELRQAPFYLWIHDLSIPDPFFILPLLMGASMVLQTRLNPVPPDPTQAMVMKWMPVMFTVFFLFFPAGLVLYWLVNNILSIAQQWVITKKIENDA